MTSENLAYLTYCIGEQNTMGFDSKQVNAIQKQSKKIPPNRMTQSMAPGVQGGNDRVTASTFMRGMNGDEDEESYASDSDDDSED